MTVAKPTLEDRPADGQEIGWLPDVVAIARGEDLELRRTRVPLPAKLLWAGTGLVLLGTVLSLLRDEVMAEAALLVTSAICATLLGLVLMGLALLFRWEGLARAEQPMGRQLLLGKGRPGDYRTRGSAWSVELDGSSIEADELELQVFEYNRMVGSRPRTAITFAVVLRFDQGQVWLGEPKERDRAESFARACRAHLGLSPPDGAMTAYAAPAPQGGFGSGALAVLFMLGIVAAAMSSLVDQHVLRGVGPLLMVAVSWALAARTRPGAL